MIRYICIIITLSSTNLYAQISTNLAQKVRPKYEFGVGFIGLNLPNYPGAKANTLRVIPFPWLIYRSDILQADEEGNRFRLFKSDKVELGFSGGFNFPIESDKNDARKGMPDTDALLGIGPGLLIRLTPKNSLDRFTIGIGLRLNYSVKTNLQLKQQGILLEPNIRYWHKESYKSPWTFFSSFSFSTADYDYNKFFYQVNEEYKTSIRDSYKAKSGLVDVSLSAGVAFNTKGGSSMFIGLYNSNLSMAANKESPLVETENNIGVVFGYTKLLYVSKQTYSHL